MTDVKENEPRIQQDVPASVKHSDNRIENMIKMYEIYNGKGDDASKAKAAQYLAMIEQLSPWEEMYRKNFTKITDIHKNYVAVMNLPADRRGRGANQDIRLKWLELASRFGNNVADIAEKLTDYQYSKKLEEEYADLDAFLGLNV